VAAPASAPTPLATPISTPAAPKRGPWAAVAVVAAVAASVTIGWTVLGAKTRAADTTPAPASSSPAAAASATAAAPAAAPAKVLVEITTTPPGAHVRVGEEDRGETPAKLELERTDTPITIELTLDGYEARTETVTPNVDQRLSLSLTVAPRARPGFRAPPPASATASGGRYRKFN
jgi:hypothetical protein